jgi:hypothetical protein
MLKGKRYVAASVKESTGRRECFKDGDEDLLHEENGLETRESRSNVLERGTSLEMQFLKARQLSRLPQRAAIPKNPDALAVKTKKVDTLALIAITAALLLLIPLIPSEYLDFRLAGTEFDINSRSLQCYVFAVGTLSVAVTLLADLALDFIFTKRMGYMYMRLFSVITLILCTIVYVCPRNYDSWAQVQLLLGKFQFFSQIAASSWFLNAIDRTGCWNKRWVTFLLLLYASSDFLDCLVIILPESKTVAVISYILQYSCFTFLFGTSFLWIYVSRIELLHILFGRKQSKTKDKKQPSFLSCYSLTVIVVFICCALIDTISTVIIRSYTSSDVHSTADYRCVTLVNRTLLTFFLCIIPGRMFKGEVAIHEYNATVKSSFVRYVSHEVHHLDFINPVFTFTIFLDRCGIP